MHDAMSTRPLATANFRATDYSSVCRPPYDEAAVSPVISGALLQVQMLRAAILPCDSRKVVTVSWSHTKILTFSSSSFTYILPVLRVNKLETLHL